MYRYTATLHRQFFREPDFSKPEADIDLAHGGL